MKDIEGFLKPNESNILIEVVKDNEALAGHFARTMADAVIANNKKGEPTRFIMPVGPTSQYRIFAQICNEEKINLAGFHMFNMDEYVGMDGANLPKDHPFSFANFVNKDFVSLVEPDCNLNREQMHIPDARDPTSYTKIIEEAGGIDICFGGIGLNGHIAFNEPLNYWEVMKNEEFRNLPTRVIKITMSTIATNSIFGTGGNLSAIPPFAVTVGMREILSSRKLHFYLDWHWQRYPLRYTLFGPVTPMFPSTFLREHPDMTITITENVAQEPSLCPE